MLYQKTAEQEDRKKKKEKALASEEFEQEHEGGRYGDQQSPRDHITTDDSCLEPRHGHQVLMVKLAISLFNISK